MFGSKLLLQAYTTSKQSKNLPFRASKANLASNILISTLYALGAWSIYKEVKTVREFEDTAPLDPSKDVSPAELIISAPNRIFKPIGNSSMARSEPFKILETLTYGDFSQLAIGSGFLIQLSNIIHSEFGRKSFMYKTSIVTTVVFPAVLYFAFKLRVKELKEHDVPIE